MRLQPVSRSGPGPGGLLDRETGPVTKSNPVANPMPSSKSSTSELSSDYVSESEHSSSVASAGLCSVVVEEKPRGVYLWYAKKIENALFC
jgi:hypothetical protein